MIDASPETYHEELGQLSQRLQLLREDFRQHGMISDADRAILDQVQREKDGLEEKLSEAERTGQWPTFADEYGRIWNSFITDLEMLELRLMDNEMIRSQHKV